LKRVERQQIHVFIGTKAQYIKTAPLLRLMQEGGVPYRLIDSGQHAVFSSTLRKELGIKEPDAVLHSKGDIISVLQAVRWFSKYIMMLLFRPKTAHHEIFQDGNGVCIIHGDTPSTLLALLLAKRVGLKVAHIEAGLRSFNVFKPFPEEMIRMICMRHSDYLFAPSEWAFQNLVHLGIKGNIVNIGQNTNVEAMYYSLGRARAEPLVPEKYCLMTIHRVETILSKSRLSFVVSLAERIADRMKVGFVLHDPTRRKLEEFGLEDRLTGNPNIKISGLINHSKFLAWLACADCVVTDGGSIQEECHYLGVPCLVMRSETERQEGIGSNALLCDFDDEIVNSFFSSYSSLRGGHRLENIEPSRRILETLLADFGNDPAGEYFPAGRTAEPPPVRGMPVGEHKKISYRLIHQR